MMGLSTPGQAEITSLDSANIDDVLSKASHIIFHKCLKEQLHIFGNFI